MFDASHEFSSQLHSGLQCANLASISDEQIEGAKTLSLRQTVSGGQNSSWPKRSPEAAPSNLSSLPYFHRPPLVCPRNALHALLPMKLPRAALVLLPAVRGLLEDIEVVNLDVKAADRY